MAVGSGLGAQIGFAAETTVGTAVAVTDFVEFNSESLNLDKTVIQGKGLRGGGLAPRTSRRAYTTRTVSGDISMDLATNGLQALFKQALGAVAGTTTLTYTPALLTGSSLTIQKGVPNTLGVVKPFTISGAKIPSWKIGCNVGEIATLDVTVDAWDMVTSTALATASYSSTASVFNFSQGVLKIGGVTCAEVMSAEVGQDVPMKTDRFFFGSAGKKAEQIENDLRATTGNLTAEFVNQATIYDLYAADTGTSLELTFTHSNGAVLDITCPSIFFEGETPKVGGPDVVGLSAPFTALDNGTNPVISVAYTFV